MAGTSRHDGPRSGTVTTRTVGASPGATGGRGTHPRDRRTPDRRCCATRNGCALGSATCSGRPHATNAPPSRRSVSRRRTTWVGPSSPVATGPCPESMVSAISRRLVDQGHREALSLITIRRIGHALTAAQPRGSRRFPKRRRSRPECVDAQPSSGRPSPGRPSWPALLLAGFSSGRPPGADNPVASLRAPANPSIGPVPEGDSSRWRSAIRLWDPWSRDRAPGTRGGADT